MTERLERLRMLRLELEKTRGGGYTGRLKAGIIGAQIARLEREEKEDMDTPNRASDAGPMQTDTADFDDLSYMATDAIRVARRAESDTPEGSPCLNRTRKSRAEKRREFCLQAIDHLRRAMEIA